MSDLAVSIVLYNSPFEEYAPLVETVLASRRVRTLWLIDHSPKALPPAALGHPKVVRIHDPRNPGFGAGHNRALRDSIPQGGYHAVLNPDIRMAPDLLDTLADYMDANPEVGSVMPTIQSPDGSIQNQGRLLPSPWDLVGRRWFSKFWEKRKATIYQADHLPADRPRNVPNLSGAFLFLRCSALEKSGVFDERFFLYCEDMDLVRRLHETSRTEALPHLQAVHAHRRASYKDFRMTVVHSLSAIKYFSKWGWFKDRQRKAFHDRLDDR